MHQECSKDGLGACVVRKKTAVEFKSEPPSLPPRQRGGPVYENNNKKQFQQRLIKISLYISPGTPKQGGRQTNSKLQRYLG